MDGVAHTLDLTHPTWERYTVVAHFVSKMCVRDRRKLFQLTRAFPTPTPDLFFPYFGLTLGEFAVWYALYGCPAPSRTAVGQ